ncbi:hypothetical protein HMPREF1631_04340 [Arcanobacterium sp. S3PF19]|nr:hypothetical protein HMPREF1631_04340 [Arcanobacterium sp. S3PF19]
MLHSFPVLSGYWSQMRCLQPVFPPLSRVARHGVCAGVRIFSVLACILPAHKRGSVQVFCARRAEICIRGIRLPNPDKKLPDMGTINYFVHTNI